jgi:hypothetical protein
VTFSVEITTEEAGGSAPGLTGLQQAGKMTHGNTSDGHYRAGLHGSTTGVESDA